MELRGYPETWVTIYKYTLRNIPEARRFQVFYLYGSFPKCVVLEYIHRGPLRQISHDTNQRQTFVFG
jgi:hypothetical protein